LAPFIYREEDIKYLNKFNGQPGWLCPVVPTFFINGALGIGKDWKLQMPNFNPYDVIANIKRMIAGVSPTAMTPFYKNF
jgi:DNA topoisomerase II